MGFSTSGCTRQKRTGFNKCVIFKILLVAVCIISVYSAATSSSAFWTDSISIDQSIKALSMGVGFQESELELADDEPFMPGDSKPFSFTVENSGEISVDIKPVITITATADMVSGGNGYIIVDSNGAEITGYNKTYYGHDETKINNEEVGRGTAYRKIVYELATEDTLSGSKQNDGAKGENSSSKRYEYKVKLCDETNNDFEGVTAQLEVSTYAIQHRNRETGEGWVNIGS